MKGSAYTTELPQPPSPLQEWPAALLGIDTPKGATLWIDAIALNDSSGKPVMALPLGDRIQRKPIQESASSRQEGTEG